MMRKKKGDKTAAEKPDRDIPSFDRDEEERPTVPRVPAAAPTPPQKPSGLTPGGTSDAPTTPQKTIIMSPDEKKEALSAQHAPPAPEKESVTQRTVFMSDKEKKALLAEKKKKAAAGNKRQGIPLEPEETPRIQGLQLFGEEEEEGDAIGGMKGLERTGTGDTRTAGKSPKEQAPQKKSAKPVSDTTRIAANARPKPTPKAKAAADPFAPPPEEGLSLLDLLQDTHETGGEHFASMQNSPEVPGGKLELVYRPAIKEEPVQKAPIIRPVPVMVPNEDIIAASRRSECFSRLFFRAIPLWLLFAVIAVGGYIYIQSIMFGGTWKGVVTDKYGKEVEIELHLKRHQNQIQGDASYLRPEGETILTPTQKSGIPQVILQVMINREGYIIGSFDKKSAAFKLFPPGVTDEPSIQFNGEFMSANLLQGSAVNSFQAQGSFLLKRVSTWKLPFDIKLP